MNEIYLTHNAIAGAVFIGFMLFMIGVVKLIDWYSTPPYQEVGD